MSVGDGDGSGDGLEEEVRRTWVLEVNGWEVCAADLRIIVCAAADEVVLYGAEEEFVCWSGIASRLNTLSITALLVSP